MQHDVFCLTPDEFENACKNAVAARNNDPVTDYVARIDASGKVIKVLENGQTEAVLQNTEGFKTEDYTHDRD